MVDQASREERKLKVLCPLPLYLHTPALVFFFFLKWEYCVLQEEEQRLRKVALNISKDVKKFWIKVEKLVILSFVLSLVLELKVWHNFWASEPVLLCGLPILQVLYKHQLVRNEKKKKAMDKQLEFLLGQTERLLWNFSYTVFFFVIVNKDWV